MLLHNRRTFLVLKESITWLIRKSFTVSFSFSSAGYLTVVHAPL